MIEELIGIL
jgi:hypothetical protein